MGICAKYGVFKTGQIHSKTRNSYGKFSTTQQSKTNYKETIFQQFFSTSQEFMKLEKIEFGGVKGRVFSQLVLELFDKFQDTYRIFGERTYNPLDPETTVCNKLNSFFFGVMFYFITTGMRMTAKCSCPT